MAEQTGEKAFTREIKVSYSRFENLVRGTRQRYLSVKFLSKDTLGEMPGKTEPGLGKEWVLRQPQPHPRSAQALPCTPWSVGSREMEGVGHGTTAVLARHTELPFLLLLGVHLPAPLSSHTALACLASSPLHGLEVKRSQWAVRSRHPTCTARFLPQQGSAACHTRLAISGRVH